MSEDLYFVVKNNEDQYSVWMEGRSLSAGWVTVGEAGSKQQCLERVEQLWTDMTPRSVREHLKQQAAIGDEHAV
ncbi:MbtH family NRPS accessory protein [Massilia sp. CCM 9210]|uniref:MbtH family protein n=1 Tax=Massilia scottii TaxID=3057166 RepID=UPI002796843B|nr:MbtH family NRPS accessory protein [Massilia sp. CCM 9210]MDQ1815086.1 MbtH family NRPS accessory protein [Massilia sp. CCM 9210]